MDVASRRVPGSDLLPVRRATQPGEWLVSVRAPYPAFDRPCEPCVSGGPPPL